MMNCNFFLKLDFEIFNIKDIIKKCLLFILSYSRPMLIPLKR